MPSFARASLAVQLAGAALLAGRAWWPEPGQEPASARDRLLLIAAAAGRVAGDASTGPYSRIHLVRWVRTGAGAIRFDSERWRAADGSGRLVERRLDAPGAPAVRTDYPPGSLLLRTADPADGPTAVATSLLDMIGIRYLDRPARAAALRTLASLPGLAGTGPAFTLTAGANRLTIVVDPATAELTGWQYDDGERVEILSRTRVPGFA
ncbi:hypothetical protein [Dactylosporangium sp. CA-233914]|uniref:hypothetical protein n=1 Tax=Dactylosporangium sp. CA-233914 TaxID=3239934 RepID=UPI003D8DD6DC